MITITRNLARQVRAVLRRALHVTRSGLFLPVTLETGAEGLRIWAKSPDAAVQYHAAGDYATERIALPFEFLADCEGRKEEPVQLAIQGEKRVSAEWRDRNVPQIVEYDLVPPTEDRQLLGIPDTLAQNECRLLRALRDASDTADADPIRYATNHLRLRGADGSVAATDGHALMGVASQDQRVAGIFLRGIRCEAREHGRTRCPVGGEIRHLHGPRRRVVQSGNMHQDETPFRGSLTQSADVRVAGNLLYPLRANAGGKMLPEFAQDGAREIVPAERQAVPSHSCGNCQLAQGHTPGRGWTDRTDWEASHGCTALPGQLAPTQRTNVPGRAMTVALHAPAAILPPACGPD